MNVFILCSGRNGSVTFSRACQHITNYTASHESRTRYLGVERFAYPHNHIEADNRLSWMLGRLYQHYGDEAFYVHMTRDENKVAESFYARYDAPGSIVRAYHTSILMGATAETPILEVCHDFCDTVNMNIALFLRDRPNKMCFPLEQATELFPEFWEHIGAEGDLDAAMAEWSIPYNQRRLQPTSVSQGKSTQLPLLRRVRKVLRKGNAAFHHAFPNWM
jgi:hypothetical protein